MIFSTFIKNILNVNQGFTNQNGWVLSSKRKEIEKNLMRVMNLI